MFYNARWYDPGINMWVGGSTGHPESSNDSPRKVNVIPFEDDHLQLAVDQVAQLTIMDFFFP